MGRQKYYVAGCGQHIRCGMTKAPETKETQELQSLLERCRRPDSAAWAILVKRFEGLVYSVARKYRLNTDDASDMFQATFTALYRNLNTIHHGAVLPKWLSITASREAQRLYRLSNRNESYDALSLDEILADQDLVAEQDAVQSIHAESVRKALTTLATRCRELLIGLYLDEATDYASVSQKTGIPIGAIGPTRARCLEKLRKNLQKLGFFEEHVY